MNTSVILVTTLIAFTVPASAEEVSDTSKQVKITCETILICQKLSESLQAQIDTLEAQGIENLTDDEFEHYAKLSDDLIAAIKLETQYNKSLIVAENKKQSEQKRIIASENYKQEQMRLSQEQEIAELRDMLLGQ